MSSGHFTRNTDKAKHLFSSQLCSLLVPTQNVTPSTQLLKPQNTESSLIMFFLCPMSNQSESAMRSTSKLCLEPTYVFAFLPLLSQPLFSCLNSHYFPFTCIFQPPGPSLCSANNHVHFYLLDFLLPLSGMLFS